MTDVRPDELHPELRRIAKLLPRSSYTRRTVRPVQALTKLMWRLPAKGVETLPLPGTDVALRVHRPAAVRHPGRALLWLHGGGYVIGSAAQDDSVCRRFAERLGVPVVAVEYRLAPQHPYPAAPDDCHAALTWLAGRPDVDADKIAIAGASAGGGLTAALALLARNRGEVTPLFQLLVYPMLDDQAASDPATVSPHARLWSTTTNRVGWGAYLRGVDAATRDTAVPARRNDLAGLPPAWLGVGTIDSLRGEGEAYAERLRAAGVPCELDVVAGVFHGFDAVAPKSGVARAFFERQCVALERAFAGA